MENNFKRSVLAIDSRGQNHAAGLNRESSVPPDQIRPTIPRLHPGHADVAC